MKIRKIFMLFFIVLLPSIIRPNIETLSFGSAINWYPYYMKSSDNKFYGASIDIINEIASKNGFHVKIIGDVPWKRQLYMLERGKQDIIGAIYYTSERAKKYTYSEPFATDEARAFVIKGNEFKFNKLEDLIGRVGGRPLGGSYGEKFDNFAKENLDFEYARTKELLVKMLQYKRAEYLVFSYWDMMAYLRKINLDKEVVALKHPITKTKVYFMFSKKSKVKKYIPAINKELRKMKKDGRLKKIFSKY